MLTQHLRPNRTTPRSDPAWVERLGPTAAALLRRRVAYVQQFRLSCLLVLLGGIFSQLIHTQVGLAISVFGGVILMGTFGTLQVRTLIAAQRASIEYLGLPADCQKWIPILSYGDFDVWMARRGTPGWPRRAPRS